MLVNNTFLNFENEAIIKNILDVNCDETKDILLQQYNSSIVIKRDFNKVGFYTYFKVPDNIKKLNDSIKPFGNIAFSINNSECEVGCLLFVKNGVLHFLECYTISDGELPVEIMCYKLQDKPYIQ